MAGNYGFSNGGAAGSVINQGTLTAAQGGYIALLAPEVRNEGIITATLGTALLGAGDKVTLNLNNGSLLSYTTDQGSLNALAENKQLIQADGGQVFMSAKAADALSTAVVNNTGIIEARTIQNVGGVIKLMGDMQTGSVNVGGTLDASAPNGGNGGFIETSAAHVRVANDAKITTLAAQGITGNWLIDPTDYTIAAVDPANGSSYMSNSALSTSLGSGNVTIQTLASGTGNGDIFVNDAITWTANTTLTLSAFRHVNVNQLIDASVGATGAGSVVLRADNTGKGPGAAAGTVNFTGAGAVSLNTGTANIYYNPSSYATPTNYTTNVSVGVGTLNSYMLVFVNNASATAQNKVYDGSTTAILNTPFTFLTGPDGVTAGQFVSLSAGTAAFNSKDVATANTVTFSGYSLSGADAGLYSLFSQPANQTASITPATLTATISAPNKAYDGTTTATPAFTITGGLIGTETVTATGTATFNSKDVLTANLVTANSNVLANGLNGGLASNYSLVTGQTAAASITPATLTATISAPNKAYDGTTTATPTFTITGGLIGTETVTATGTATFNSKDVLTANLVTANSNVLANGLNGGLASNYSLVTGQTVAANITPATLTATISAPNKAYDGTTTATPTFTITGGLIGTETVTATGTATFNSKDVLTANLVTANSNVLANGLNGGLASNYSLVTGQTVAANITPATLTATICCTEQSI